MDASPAPVVGPLAPPPRPRSGDGTGRRGVALVIVGGLLWLAATAVWARVPNALVARASGTCGGYFDRTVRLAVGARQQLRAFEARQTGVDGVSCLRAGGAASWITPDTAVLAITPDGVAAPKRIGFATVTVVGQYRWFGLRQLRGRTVVQVVMPGEERSGVMGGL